jgi:hypothetical protein
MSETDLLNLLAISLRESNQIIEDNLPNALGEVDDRRKEALAKYNEFINKEREE